MMSHGATALDVALTWGTLGAATMIAPVVWRAPRAQWHPSRALAAVAAVLAVGATIPLFATSLPAMLLSAFLFGMAMLTTAGSVTDLVKRSLPRAAWAEAIALFTIVFAVGQAIGPVLAGWLGDLTHSLRAGLAASVVILLVAGLVALLQSEHASETSAAARA
jgi:MFS family permease